MLTMRSLQGVQRHQTGNYTCIVSNLEGDAQSNEVMLKILCEFILCKSRFPLTRTEVTPEPAPLHKVSEKELLATGKHPNNPHPPPQARYFNP